MGLITHKFNNRILQHIKEEEEQLLKTYSDRNLGSLRKHVKTSKEKIQKVFLLHTDKPLSRAKLKYMEI